MEHNLSIHVRMFNDRVRAMNQTQKKELTLTAAEARNLHSDIFALLTHIAEISGDGSNGNEDITVLMDGGGFK
jgi:hypothetical protein